MKSSIIAAFLAVFALLVPASFAQSEESPLAFLEGHEGEWIVSGRRATPSGWEDSARLPAQIESLYGGRAYIETSIIDFGDEQSGLTTLISWDGFRDVYRIAALDEGFGLLDIYEGRLDSEGRLIATNLRSDTYFAFGESTRMHFQLRWTFESEDRFLFEVLMTSDGGANWSPYFELIYTRAGQE